MSLIDLFVPPKNLSYNIRQLDCLYRFYLNFSLNHFKKNILEYFLYIKMGYSGCGKCCKKKKSCYKKKKSCYKKKKSCCMSSYQYKYCGPYCYQYINYQDPCGCGCGYGYGYGYGCGGSKHGIYY